MPIKSHWGFVFVCFYRHTFGYSKIYMGRHRPRIANTNWQQRT